MSRKKKQQISQAELKNTSLGDLAKGPEALIVRTDEVPAGPILPGGKITIGPREAHHCGIAVPLTGMEKHAFCPGCHGTFSVEKFKDWTG